MTNVISEAGKVGIVSYIKKKVTEELVDVYPDLTADFEKMKQWYDGYISLDFDGLAKTVAELIGGITVEVDTNGFANDLVTFRNQGDVLTLLIHLGYLAYDEETQRAYIPNEEIRREFAETIREVKRDETIQRVKESNQLIHDTTVYRNAEAVAAQIEKIHAEETAVLFYNDEQALRSVIKLAYFSYKDYYLKFEELPAGDGYADIVYIPKKFCIAGIDR